MIADGEKSRASEREKRLQKKISELSTLYEVSEVLTSVLTLDEALKLIVKTTTDMMGMKACGLRLLDKTSGEMVLKAVYGLSQEYIYKGRVFVWKGVYKNVILGGQAAIVKDVATDPRFEYTKQAVEEGIKSMLSVGLMIRGEPIGALSVYTAQRHLFTRDQISIFEGIANEAAAVIEKAMLYEERIENQRIQQELAVAAKIQANLMPQMVPQLPGYEIAVGNIPARIIGGDFYDFIPFDKWHLGIVIADVSGKGIPGSILMASARASLRAYVAEPHTVEGAITKLNRVLCRDTQSEQFVSLFYGMLDAQDGTFTYTNAGHNAPVLFRDHDRILLEEGGPILGILQGASYEEEQTQLLVGNLVLFYTDGVTEAECDDESFGEARLLELAQANISKSSHEVMEKVFEEVAEFSSSLPQSDDRTIIVLKVSP